MPISHFNLPIRGIKKNDEHARFIFDSVMIKRLRSELRKKTGPSPRVSVDEGEEAALEAALAGYLEVCEREIANGARAPFADEKDMIGLIREAMKIESRRGGYRFRSVAEANGFETEAKRVMIGETKWSSLRT
jgi:hypothetical protein